MNQAVRTEMNGQPSYNGIIEHVDENHLYLIVPVDENRYSDCLIIEIERRSTWVLFLIVLDLTMPKRMWEI
ncbi:hypothetical protein RYX56_17990 [Alkalihalophilus lindianensis]|uniref:Uncharacterized protein n=1 Tax=Alkalihalophilus lindianensis TaxID=1630542 RepID=A0ABU3XED9_9BACI|nr:hypothetical protein [Alkalihalophilus lindianensis]MDV2686262.1 hypothetical protein [Alkalihalophilus lindianensis]